MRLKVIALRYVTYMKEKNCFPIRFNSVGWYFEPDASPRLAKVLDYVISQPRTDLKV